MNNIETKFQSDRNECTVGVPHISDLQINWLTSGENEGKQYYYY